MDWKLECGTPRPLVEEALQIHCGKAADLLKFSRRMRQKEDHGGAHGA
jgi:hypothetical protein